MCEKEKSIDLLKDGDLCLIRQYIGDGWKVGVFEWDSTPVSFMCDSVITKGSWRSRIVYPRIFSSESDAITFAKEQAEKLKIEFRNAQ